MKESAALGGGAGVNDEILSRRPSIATPQGLNDRVKDFVAERDSMRGRIEAKAAGMKASVQKLLLPTRDGGDLALGLTRMGVPSAAKIVQSARDSEARANVHAKASVV